MKPKFNWITQEGENCGAAFDLNYENNLKNLGVESVKGTVFEPGLVFLFKIFPNAANQDEITSWYKNNTDIDYNKQLRHTAGKGWFLISGNPRYTIGVCDKSMKTDQLRLGSLTEVNPKKEEHELKRGGILSAESWEEILEIFKDRGCALCGRRFENYDKGHLDPRLGYSKENIVPLCPECNNYCSDRFILMPDKKDPLLVRVFPKS